MAGAMSMAAGEYVSVHSQSDTEQADLARERVELETDATAEQRGLATIDVGRGLTPELASKVATQWMAHDALGAHARNELGLSDTQAAGRTSHHADGKRGRCHRLKGFRRAGAGR